MKNIIIILSTFLSLIGYSQTVEVHTTLLRINGIEQGQLLIDKILPIAWEYQFVVTDTLDWTTIDIDSLAVRNDDLQLQVDSLEVKLNDLIKLLKTQPIICQ